MIGSVVTSEFDLVSVEVFERDRLQAADFEAQRRFVRPGQWIKFQRW